jgi:hypothetical protein
MNRRDVLKIMGVSAVACVVPTPVIAKPKPTWFTHEQLVFVHDWMVANINYETMDFDKEEEEDYDYGLYLPMIRASNIIHRKTLVELENRWLVAGPKLMGKIVPFYNILDLSNEVSPGIFKIGCYLCAYNLYMDLNFPENSCLMGFGDKLRKNIKHESNGKVWKVKEQSCFATIRVKGNYSRRKVLIEEYKRIENCKPAWRSNPKYKANSMRMWQAAWKDLENWPIS